MGGGWGREMERRVRKREGESERVAKGRIGGRENVEEVEQSDPSSIITTGAVLSPHGVPLGPLVFWFSGFLLHSCLP